MRTTQMRAIAAATLVLGVALSTSALAQQTHLNATRTRDHVTLQWFPGSTPVGPPASNCSTWAGN